MVFDLSPPDADDGRTNESDFCPIGTSRLALLPLPFSMSAEPPSGTRFYPRASLPKGMFAAWYGGGDQQVSRVATLGMGGSSFSKHYVQVRGLNQDDLTDLQVFVDLRKWTLTLLK